MIQNFIGSKVGGGSTPVINPLSVTENGTYTAPTGVDGYNPIIVNVPTSSGNPYEIINELITQQLCYFKTDATGQIPFYSLSASDGIDLALLKFFSMKNANKMYTGSLRRSSIVYANVGNVASIPSTSLYISTLKTLVIPKKTVASLSNVNAFIATANFTVYVPDSIVASYHVATNWTNYSNKIKGYSDATGYSDGITYNIGDVCKYNGKFYGYCKEDLTSSTGNAPSGTADDNTYWEYVDDIVTA